MSNRALEFIADRIKRLERQAESQIEEAVRLENDAVRLRAEAADARAFVVELKALRP